jgi:adenine-specific DNA methylase
LSTAKTKKERVAEAVAKAVGAGKPADVETVDFSDPNRPKTCLEVDFPILPINQITAIEGKGSGALKPIYQVMKWWARRRSSVFRAMLIAAATKAPDDPAEAAKRVWDVYYANHQKLGRFQHLKVADIFMGGGTTVVEGSRLGMQMFGNDLNPVAWFVVKNELAKVDPDEVSALLGEIEAEVKPQIMPFYACDCPHGHRGQWTRVSTGEVMKPDFDPRTLAPAERRDYRYEGPEIIYVFWAKHGPCQVTGCGHRTPIMSSPVMAIKTLTVKAWENYGCGRCGKHYDVEAQEARMAPGVPLVVAETEKPYAVLDAKGDVTCPHCGHREQFTRLSVKAKNRKIELSLLVHPQWLKGSPSLGAQASLPARTHAAGAVEMNERDGGSNSTQDACAPREYGGSATDSAEATAAWNQERARQMRLVEVRGALPEEITDPETGITFRTDKGTVIGRGIYACGACGTSQRFTESTEKTQKAAPVAAFAIQGFCPWCDKDYVPYGGRFFAAVKDSSAFDAAQKEWEQRSEADLKDLWPRSEIPFGHETHQRQPLPQQGYTNWWKMFNPRQLLVHTQLLRAILNTDGESPDWRARELVLGAFQQYLRNQNTFCFWNLQRALEPHFSNNNFHPKSTFIENGVFSGLGRGDFRACIDKLIESLEWACEPWEIACGNNAEHGEKVSTEDELSGSAMLWCASATESQHIADGSLDLVITDPPFGDNVQYAELGEFFYVWLRLALKDRYPKQFGAEYTPKMLEAVANKARHDDPDAFYQRLLTECWREAYRILKPGGILAFTFHHSEDEPWVAVLESLFDAGFYLEATYPIRSDETKGEGEFGSKKIEYDIIHVCRKRAAEPQPVSWGRMRREVLRDVRQLQEILEHHAKQGLPAADLQVIKRGKALEYFSRHYGKVFVDEERTIGVKEALVGINQLIDEEGGKASDPPPVNAEPMTRQFLRLFNGKTELARDQMQKFLRGTGLSPAEFVERGWCFEEKKVYYPTPPLTVAQEWRGRHRQKMTSDFDQAMFLIGACHEGSGINVSDTLKNENFRPHPALGALLDWQARHGASSETKNAAMAAAKIYRAWENQHQDKVQQMSFFE